MVFAVEFVSRNLGKPSNFVEFRDSRNFTYFEAFGQSRGDTLHKGGCVPCGTRVRDTWHMGGPSVMPSNLA